MAHHVGQVQTLILLSVIYHTAVAIVGLTSRLRGQDVLRLRRPDTSSYWETLPETTSTIDRARKQF